MGLIFIIFILVLLLGLLALPGIYIQSIYKKYNQPNQNLPGTGAELAQHLLKEFGMNNYRVEKTPHPDHYSPQERKIYLNEEICDQRSLTSVSVAAHEFSHALQDHNKEKLFSLTMILGKLTRIAEKVASLTFWLTPIVGILTRNPAGMFAMLLFWLGIAALSFLFQCITMINEWDANFKKAIPILKKGNYLNENEIKIVKKLLTAASLTYFASTLRNLLMNSRIFRSLRR